ncbi:OLC1v1025265C1 [Oldenlandia corymbosa var. corymbosa]|uniref:OLC1v1025265C1 n=1 Tax=Oldenlandia corymbosa var. corymbosa TaxID=529605 RepID=A0AAV1C577_OLDCO|nr:OLC1v1025265C1 [Oldenlandia corymbosa var. corymbosa]
MNQGHSESSESRFYSAITRVSVAQICQSVGYKKAQNRALDILSNIAGRFIQAIADSATVSANSGGRTESNLADIVSALEELGSVQGFVGAHELQGSHCLMSSSVLKGIMRVVDWNEESPFAQPIPKKILPDVKKSGCQTGLVHVPRWLPEMPEITGNGLGLETKIRTEVMWEETSRKNFAERERKLLIEGSEKVKKGFELPEKRMKVKFKMGMGMVNKSFGMDIGMRNSGVFSRSGNGKRILCQGWNDE